MNVLQWGFLALAIAAAIAELHFGTIYLAGVAVAALVTVGIGFVIGNGPDILVFVVACVCVIVAVPFVKRRFGGRRAADLDVGHTVVFLREGRRAGEVIVDYRGAQWEADIDPSTVVKPGAAGRITARHGNRLRVAAVQDDDISKEP